MPVITIRLGKGRPIENGRALASRLAVAEVLHVHCERVTVLIEDYDCED